MIPDPPDPDERSVRRCRGIWPRSTPATTASDSGDIRSRFSDTLFRSPGPTRQAEESRRRATRHEEADIACIGAGLRPRRNRRPQVSGSRLAERRPFGSRRPCAESAIPVAQRCNAEGQEAEAPLARGHPAPNQSPTVRSEEIRAENRPSKPNLPGPVKLSSIFDKTRTIINQPDTGPIKPGRPGWLDISIEKHADPPRESPQTGTVP